MSSEHEDHLLFSVQFCLHASYCAHTNIMHCIALKQIVANKQFHLLISDFYSSGWECFKGRNLPSYFCNCRVPHFSCQSNPDAGIAMYETRNVLHLFLLGGTPKGWGCSHFLMPPLHFLTPHAVADHTLWGYSSIENHELRDTWRNCSNEITLFTYFSFLYWDRSCHHLVSMTIPTVCCLFQALKHPEIS